MANSYLLAFHVGPVQDFIAAARRTQDWWVGSWLLSHLSRTAIKAVPNYEDHLVLPKELPKSDDTAIADTPNHFIARLLDESPARVAQKIEDSVKEEWRRIHQQVKEEFFQSVSNELWARQLETLLEIYWALVSDSGEGSRNRAQTALEARKRLRDFAVTQEPHLKCTLCGVRQELSEMTTAQTARDWWIELVNRYSQRPHLEKLRIRENGNERLCAVCVVKRAAVAAAAAQKGRGKEPAVPLAKTDASFPSTSSVAAATFKKRLLEKGKAQNELANHLQVLEHLGIPAKIEERCLLALAEITTSLSKDVRDKLLTFDGSLFYAETFTEKRLNEAFPGTTAAILKYGSKELEFTEEELLQLEPNYVGQQIANAEDNLRAVFRTVRSDGPIQHISPPSKYFAALKMDGDHMGAFFGKMAEEVAQNLSRRMSQFASEKVKKTVDSHFGRLVYAGGDDALALLPLEEALSCARKLQQQFREAVDEFLKGVELPSGVKRPTPSIGIAIAHYTQPLDATLSTMRRAEHAAKNHYGRDALCVHVLKRSGQEVRIGTHWKHNDFQLLEVVEQAVKLLREDALSMKFPYAVASEARALAELPLPAREAELKRLAKRHQGRNPNEDASTALTARLAVWADVEHGNERNQKPLGLKEVAQWLLLARFIARGGRDEE